MHVVAVRLDLEHLVGQRVRRRRVEEHLRAVAFDHVVALDRLLGVLDLQLELVAADLDDAEPQPSGVAENLEGGVPDRGAPRQCTHAHDTGRRGRLGTRLCECRSRGR